MAGQKTISCRYTPPPEKVEPEFIEITCNGVPNVTGEYWEEPPKHNGYKVYATIIDQIIYYNSYLAPGYWVISQTIGQSGGIYWEKAGDRNGEYQAGGQATGKCTVSGY